MAILFRTLCSSSSGNCLQLTCDGATLLLDCGFGSQKTCEAALETTGEILGVLISHAHGDHVGYSGLKVLARRGVPVLAHGSVLQQFTHRFDYFDGWAQVPQTQAFAAKEFHVGPFHVRPIAVSHAPGVPTFGFAIQCGGRKLVFCTDFYDPRPIAEACIDADFIYIESNHDLDLLRRHPNYASRFHLSNPKTASLLVHALGQSAKPPQEIVLGHLSSERNTPELALATINDGLQRAELKPANPIRVSPLHKPSDAIAIQ